MKNSEWYVSAILYNLTRNKYMHQMADYGIPAIDRPDRAGDTEAYVRFLERKFEPMDIDPVGLGKAIRRLRSR